MPTAGKSLRASTSVYPVAITEPLPVAAHPRHYGLSPFLPRAPLAPRSSPDERRGRFPGAGRPGSRWSPPGRREPPPSLPSSLPLPPSPPLGLGSARRGRQESWAAAGKFS